MTFRLALIATVGLLLAACSTPKIWPFYKKPVPPPEAVHEVDLANADGSAASYPQYWKRNTLVIDLSGVSGTGTVSARLPADTTWPVRVAVRVLPGSVEQLEVVGEERNVLAVSREGTMPIDIEFPPSVFRPTTGALYISWGHMPQFAEVVIDEKPGFVSPTEVPRAPAAPDGAAPEVSPEEGALRESASDIIAPAASPPQESAPGS